jgi:hypothetical protein
MLGLGLLALGLSAFAATLFFVRFLFRREVGAYIDRVAELERRLMVVRAEKRRLEEEVDSLRRHLSLLEIRVGKSEVLGITGFLPGPRPRSS